VEKALHPLNPLVKMKTLATREKGARAIAATMGVMVTKLPGMPKNLRRLTLRNSNFRNICLSRLFVYICVFMKL
jgi:hypothetical protein